MVIIYTGDGKGKSTAAAGSALRMAGHGRRVLYAQFLKDSTSGECQAFRYIKEIKLLLPERCFGFTFHMDEATRKTAIEFYKRYWEQVRETAETGAYSMVILDEVIGAIGTGMLEEEQVLGYLKENRAKTEIVLTGRNPSDKLAVLGDYVTDMRKLRHPFDSGIPAREGIEK